MQNQQNPTLQQRQSRVTREHNNELQKIELAAFDVSEVEIDTRILKKIQRKIHRRK